MGCFLDEIPCEECIAYALCRHKKLIECDELYDWFDCNFADGNRYCSGAYIFTSVESDFFNKNICNYFPNTMRVFIGVPNNSVDKRRVFLAKDERGQS
jgi:hypothetical protein